MSNRTWRTERKRWIRSRHLNRSNRLLPGAAEYRFGKWHIVLEIGTGQTWCGRVVERSCATPQRRNSEPELDEINHRRCPECAEAYASDRPVPVGQAS